MSGLVCPLPRFIIKHVPLIQLLYMQRRWFYAWSCIAHLAKVYVGPSNSVRANISSKLSSLNLAWHEKSGAHGISNEYPRRRTSQEIAKHAGISSETKDYFMMVKNTEKSTIKRGSSLGNLCLGVFFKSVAS